MISKIDKIPDNVVGFKISGNIEATDFTTILIPAVQHFMKSHKDLNYMLVLDNDMYNFSVKWWMKSLWISVRDLTQWNRCAIISNLTHLKNFTNDTCKEWPGELRIYPNEQQDDAVRWLKG